MLNTLMNVRQQSGRRRGRGGQNRQGGGGRGPESGNRIDNRARGNAPQLLEKYKGLARDAQQAGDRVLMEYYLQFADHYFRVVMESRARQDEQRAPRGDGDQNGQDDGDDTQDVTDDGEDDFGFKLPPRQERPRQERQDRGERNDRGDRGDRQERGERNDRGPREDRQPREDRGERNYNGNGNGEGRGPQQPRFDTDEAEAAPRRRELPPRRDRSARAEDGGPASFDTSVLPPAIGGSAANDGAPESLGGLPMGMEGEPIELPTPKRRGRPRKDASAAPAEDA